MKKNFDDSQERRTLLNVSSSLCYQIVSVLCGILIPNLMIRRFGSELYGASSSILQFLSYISLLEGGIGGVARAAFYKPLACNDYDTVNRIIDEMQRFYRIIAYIFIVYVLVLACSFSKISHIESLDWSSSFALVLIMSLSTIVQYYFEVSYTALIISDQRTFVSDFISVLNMILNTVLIVVLVNSNCSFLAVKLVSSLVFVLRPVLLAVYVRKRYPLKKSNHVREGGEPFLKQKWIGLGQHIAYFLYYNTDVVVLTLFTNLKIVAVYSVYSLITSSMQNLIMTVCSGMEANFGSAFAKGEEKKLLKVFDNYELLVSIIATALLAVTAVMILPFVELYTAGVNDVNYIEPIFAILMVLVVFVACIREPYNCMIVASGSFAQTQVGAYGEAALNIVLSVVLVRRFGIVGVAVGTLVAVLFRTVYNVFFLAKAVLKRPVAKFFKRLILNAVSFAIVFLIGKKIASLFAIVNYFNWVCCSFVVIAISIACVLSINLLFCLKGVRGLKDFFASKEDV